jgi:hypothetical protein
MADENNKQTPQTEPVLNDDDLMEGSLDDLNRKVETAYKGRLEKALEDYKKEHPEKPATPTAPEDVLKEFECFGSEDEDVREAAQAMLEKELDKLPENAGVEKVREACDKVAKRVAKLVASKDNEKTKEEDPYGKGPVQTGGGGAATAHINDKPPQSIDEAYDLSARIADGWGKK